MDFKVKPSQLPMALKALMYPDLEKPSAALPPPKQRRYLRGAPHGL